MPNEHLSWKKLPPLAVVGIGLTNREFLLAANASVLFATNLVAIILGAAFVFQMMGVHLSRRGEAMPAWARRAMVLLATSESFSPDFEEGLIDAIYAARGEDDTKLRIFTLLEAPMNRR
jgi:uncharacterized membrane protein